MPVRRHAWMPALLLTTVIAAAPAAAQDLNACHQIPDLVAEEAWADLLFELDMCKGAAEKAWFDGMVEAVSVPIEGLEPSNATVEGAMGITALTFGHGPIESTFTSGVGQAENPMSALSGLGGLASALGVRQEGMEEVRLGRRQTGMLEEKHDGYTLTVSLDEGMLVHEGPDRDQLIAVSRAIIEIIQDYMR